MNINSKFKILNPKQIQNTKSKIGFKTFEFLILDLFRVSGLGFRVCLTLICAYFFSACQKPVLYNETRVMLGTFADVQSCYQKAAAIVFAELARVEHLLSKYDQDSEISCLNRTGRVKASKDTLYIINKAKQFWQGSEGAFDVTVGPLVNLWGWTKKDFAVPDSLSLKKTLELVGFDKIIINEGENLIQFKTPGMVIDLGAIGKGYAVDCAVRKLKEKGIDSCLINLGGHIFALGRNFNRPWHIAIRDPRGKNEILPPPRRGQDEGAENSPPLHLVDKAVATSGDYEQYFIKNNVRYSHIINPKTGYPVNSGVSSVTVIADDCLTADALATAIFVLGREKGLVLAEKYPEVRVKIVE